MPEGIEIEIYRRAALATVGRTIAWVDAPDAWFCKGSAGPSGLAAALMAQPIMAARRIGKLLLLDIGTVTLGLRFGMTGRLIVDGFAPIDQLEYGSSRDRPEWDRFSLGFTDGGLLRMNDPRRLGGVELLPDESLLGPDAFGIPRASLDTAISGPVAVKARLLDQARIAGIGNLLADEICWRASIDPARLASSLSVPERASLHRAVGQVLRQLTARGGSHLGDLQTERHRAGVCPRDGALLARRAVGGRSTYSCPVHQR